MATVRNRGGMLHIQWYNPFEKKIVSKSTNLSFSESNLRKAKRYANQLQEKITREYKKQKELGLKAVTISDAFDHFKRNNQNKHPKTIKDYDRFYKKFIEYFNPELSCISLNKLNIENWLIEIKKLPLAQNSIHTYGKQLNHFLNFLFEYNYTQMFRINREVKTRAEVKEKIVFSDSDLLLIISNLPEKNSNIFTTINVLLYTGLRSSDVLSINKENIDIENRILRYYSPKRKKFREIAFHEKLVDVFNNRMNEIESGKILDYSNVENLGRSVTRFFSELALKDKGYTARTFRKTFITLCRSRFDMDASVVMELVGHEHLNTTDRYYNNISINKMKSELLKFIIPFA